MDWSDISDISPMDDAPSPVIDHHDDDDQQPRQGPPAAPPYLPPVQQQVVPQLPGPGDQEAVPASSSQPPPAPPAPPVMPIPMSMDDPMQEPLNSSWPDQSIPVPEYQLPE